MTALEVELKSVRMHLMYLDLVDYEERSDELE